MKKLFLIIALLIATSAASANSIRYFTHSQAARVVSYLNMQDELMIYCGYEYELETYVLISDVWAERFNSAYYEVWVYGFDAYTGDEIYMPLDLNCVWLFSGNRIYSAARYLRFRTTASVPHITWYVPAYNHFSRMPHRSGYARTYHYDVHTYGWMPPAPPHPGYHPAPGTVVYPPYYTRTPQTPAPKPENVWTPGADKPIVVTGSRGGSGSSTERPSTRTSEPNPTTTTGSTRGTSTEGTSTGSTRGSSTSGTASGSSRGSSTNSTTNGSSRGSSTDGTASGSSRGSSISGASTGSSRGTTTTGTTTGSSRGKSTTPATDNNSREKSTASESTTTNSRGESLSNSTRSTSTSSSRGTATKESGSSRTNTSAGTSSRSTDSGSKRGQSSTTGSSRGSSTRR